MMTTMPSEAAQRGSWRFSHLRFESRAVLDGSQTNPSRFCILAQFESRAVLDGSQTTHLSCNLTRLFESRAVLDGSQTCAGLSAAPPIV